MWYYQIITEYGECLEGGAYVDKEEMRRHCERRMKQLNADNWWAEYETEGRNDHRSTETSTEEV